MLQGMQCLQRSFKTEQVSLQEEAENSGIHNSMTLDFEKFRNIAVNLNEFMEIKRDFQKEQKPELVKVLVIVTSLQLIKISNLATTCGDADNWCGEQARYLQKTHFPWRPGDLLSLVYHFTVMMLLLTCMVCMLFVKAKVSSTDYCVPHFHA